MDRRSFLKAVGAGIAALAGLGAKVVTAAPVPFKEPTISLITPQTVAGTSTIGPYDWCDFSTYEAWESAVVDLLDGGEPWHGYYATRFVRFEKADSGEARLVGEGELRSCLGPPKPPWAPLSPPRPASRPPNTTQ